MVAFMFFLFAAIAVFAAVMVILQKNPVKSALYLILAMFSLAVLYILLDAEFIAVIQILVYTGAIMVLFLFIIMLLNLRADDLPILGGLFSRKSLAIVFAGAFVAELLLVLLFHRLLAGYEIQPAPAGSHIESLGLELFTTYLLPFELISLLLLVAIIGAVVIGKRKEGKQ